jgi:hypothetical protein
MMQRKTLLLTAFSLVATTCVNAGGDWGVNHHWAFLGEAMYLQRTELHSRPIVNKTSGGRTNEVLKTKRLMKDFDWEPGYRVGISYTPSARRTFDINYFAIEEWKGDATIKGAGALSFPFRDLSSFHDFVGADKVEAVYRSRFSNGEANHWWHITPRRVNYFSVSAVLGIRGIALRESFKARFFKRTNKSEYSIKSSNYIIGPQIGGCFEANPWHFLTWNFTAKLAPLLNRASQKTFLADDNNERVIRHFKRFKWAATFLADVSASVGVQVASHFNVHVGYQFIYLAGLALAPEEISLATDEDAGERVNTHGNAIMDGAFAGIIFSF